MSNDDDVRSIDRTTHHYNNATALLGTAGDAVTLLNDDEHPADPRGDAELATQGALVHAQLAVVSELRTISVLLRAQELARGEQVSATLEVAEPPEAVAAAARDLRGWAHSDAWPRPARATFAIVADYVLGPA